MLKSSYFQKNAFDKECKVNLNACGSGFETAEHIFDNIIGINGEVTAYKVRTWWGEDENGKGLGRSTSLKKDYYNEEKIAKERKVIKTKETSDQKWKN